MIIVRIMSFLIFRRLQNRLLGFEEYDSAEDKVLHEILEKSGLQGD